MKRSPFWPARLAQHLSAPQTSLYYNLEVASTRYPDKTAIHYYGAVMSYSQLRREVDGLAGFLQRRCGGPGWPHGNRFEFAVPVNRLLEVAARRSLFTTGPQQEIDRIGCLVDGPVQEFPLTLT